MQRYWLAAGASALAVIASAQAQTYKDSNGTVVQGFVPLAGCSPGAVCAGPVSASAPLPVAVVSGGGGGGGTVAQGAPATISGAWPIFLTQGGASLSASNGLFVNPATGATFPVSGSIAATQSGTWNIGSVVSLPALAAGSNVIGAAVAQPSSASLNAMSHGASAALAASLVLKASAGNLYSVNATAISGGSPGYLVVVNASAAPANGSAVAPLDFCYFNGVAGCSLSHGAMPINYSNGIVALITSAASPYTYTSGVVTAAISGDFQ